jgi:hypothetical protein
MNDSIANDHDLGNNSENSIGPDFASWDGIRELPKAFLVPILEFLKRRTILEISVIIAQTALTVLARDVIAREVPRTRLGYVCIMALAVMLLSPALYLLYNFSKGGGVNGEGLSREGGSPDFGNAHSRPRAAGGPAQPNAGPKPR